VEEEDLAESSLVRVLEGVMLEIGRCLFLPTSLGEKFQVPETSGVEDPVMTK
jgi:hypothetical protein